MTSLGARGSRDDAATVALNQATSVEPLTLQVSPLGPSTSSDIQSLLRKRLQILATLSLGLNGLFNILRFWRLDLTRATEESLAVAAIYLGSVGVLLAILRRPRQYTLSQLRWVEAIFFGVTTVYIVHENLTALLFSDRWLILYAARHPAEMSILARQPSILWLTLIVAYGTFIPNTGVRCALATSLMASIPVVTLVAMGRVRQVPGRALVLFTSEMALWLALAVALAVYGTTKIARLRQEALTARKLGQYQLKRRLGEGGMGEVFLAEHLLLRRPCAVKVIRAEHAGNSDVLRRFLREVQLTATLTHPNTVQVFDYGQATDGTVFYAMEYLTGLTLEELVRVHGPFPPSRAIAVMRQLCGALHEAHGIGLIHRDIKPSNVILCCRGGVYDVAKLLDFGLARSQAMDPRAAEVSQAGLIFGTPMYMSPEQASGAATLSPQSDLYSLGALAYFVLVGVPPFVRETVVQTLSAHLADDPVPLRDLRPDVPADLASIIMTCLEKAPTARFPNAMALAHALDKCAASNAWQQSDAAAWWTTAAPEMLPSSSSSSHAIVAMVDPSSGVDSRPDFRA